jgi:hypothetical protein
VHQVLSTGSEPSHTDVYHVDPNWSSQQQVLQSEGTPFSNSNGGASNSRFRCDEFHSQTSPHNRFAWTTYSPSVAFAHSYQFSNPQWQHDTTGDTTGLTDALTSCAGPFSSTGSNESLSPSLVTSIVPNSSSRYPGRFTGSGLSMATTSLNTSLAFSLGDPYEAANIPAPSSGYMSSSHFNQFNIASETPGISNSRPQNGMFYSQQSPSHYMGSTPVHQGQLRQSALTNAFADLPSRSQANQASNTTNDSLYQPTTLYRLIAPRPNQAPGLSLENNEDHPYIAEE